MRLVFGLVLFFGLGLAGFAVYMAQGYITQYEAALEEERRLRESQVSVTDIYVAAKPLRYGDVLTPEAVKLIRFPEGSLPEGAFQAEEDLFPDGNNRLRMVTRAVEMNEPILDVKVTRPGQEAGISTFLADGMRAFTINVNVTSGVGGFLSPGDRVDVFWTGKASGQTITQLIFENVLIIAIDQSADQDRTGQASVARTVTVQVSPAQVASLTQAQATGRLSLSLVGVANTVTTGEIVVNQGDLLGLREEEVVEEERCTITQRSGGREIEVEIPCNNTN